MIEYIDETVKQKQLLSLFCWQTNQEAFVKSRHVSSPGFSVARKLTWVLFTTCYLFMTVYVHAQCTWTAMGVVFSVFCVDRDYLWNGAEEFVWMERWSFLKRRRVPPSGQKCGSFCFVSGNTHSWSETCTRPCVVKKLDKYSVMLLKPPNIGKSHVLLRKRHIQNKIFCLLHQIKFWLLQYWD